MKPIERPKSLTTRMLEEMIETKEAQEAQAKEPQPAKSQAVAG